MSREGEDHDDPGQGVVAASSRDVQTLAEAALEGELGWSLRSNAGSIVRRPLGLEIGPGPWYNDDVEGGKEVPNGKCQLIRVGRDSLDAH